MKGLQRKQRLLSLKHSQPDQTTRPSAGSSVKMPMKILTVTLVLLLVSSVSCAGNHRHVTKQGSCCSFVRNSISADAVIGNSYIYKPHRFPCMEIILLDTNQGQVCVDPKAKWVKKLIANMRRRQPGQTS